MDELMVQPCESDALWQHALSLTPDGGQADSEDVKAALNVRLLASEVVESLLRFGRGAA